MVVGGGEVYSKPMPFGTHRFQGGPDTLVGFSSK